MFVEVYLSICSVVFQNQKRWTIFRKIPSFVFLSNEVYNHSRVVECDLCLSSVPLWMGVRRVLDETCPTGIQGKLWSPWWLLWGRREASGGLLGSRSRGQPPLPFQGDDWRDSPTGEVVTCKSPIFLRLPVYRCEIISTTANSSMTAYLLSESSFFVDRNRYGCYCRSHQ